MPHVRTDLYLLQLNSFQELIMMPFIYNYKQKQRIYVHYHIFGFTVTNITTEIADRRQWNQ